uniref:Uncharacterized protein n=1 Tax=Plectus sambesii TaxID=2011161 RepID=A0A914WHS9_9BILA
MSKICMCCHALLMVTGTTNVSQQEQPIDVSMRMILSMQTALKDHKLCSNLSHLQQLTAKERLNWSARRFSHQPEDLFIRPGNTLGRRPAKVVAESDFISVTKGARGRECDYDKAYRFS